ncbi:hypothetical protein FD754_024740, partial [Muntiacus muntjak]
MCFCIQLIAWVVCLFGCTTYQVGSYFPDQGSNPHPLQCKHRLLTTEPPGNHEGWGKKGRLENDLIFHHPIFLFKMIYLIRNPRDVFVSGYFFWRSAKFVEKPESMEEYFEWFIQGNMPFGSWFDHTRGWMSMRDKENFLILSYEEMKWVTIALIISKLFLIFTPSNFPPFPYHTEGSWNKEKKLKHFSSKRKVSDSKQSLSVIFVCLFTLFLKIFSSVVKNLP